MTVVDLSVPLGPQLPCTWPGHTALAVEDHITEIPAGAVRSRTLRFDEHLGTHSDTRRHFTKVGDPDRSTAPGAAPVVGRARLIDVRSVRSEVLGHGVQVAATAVHEEEERSGPLAAGDVALLWTGWSDRHYRPGTAGDAYLAGPVAGELPGWPVPDIELLALLAERGVRAIGIDAPSIGAVEDPATQHLAAFESAITPIENLIHLGALRDVIDPMFVFLPLALDGATGLPGRAVGIARAWGPAGVDLR